MIDFSPLIPDDSPIVRGYNDWRCGTIRGCFTPYERIAIALYGFNPTGSFLLPVVHGVFLPVWAREYNSKSITVVNAQSVHMRFKPLPLRGHLTYSLSRAASVPLLCGLM